MADIWPGVSRSFIGEGALKTGTKIAFAQASGAPTTRSSLAHEVMSLVAASCSSAMRDHGLLERLTERLRAPGAATLHPQS